MGIAKKKKREKSPEKKGPAKSREYHPAPHPTPPKRSLCIQGEGKYHIKERDNEKESQGRHLAIGMLPVTAEKLTKKSQKRKRNSLRKLDPALVRQGGFRVKEEDASRGTSQSWRRNGRARSFVGPTVQA